MAEIDQEPAEQPNPDLDTVLQQPGELPAVPVRVDGPVYVIVQPARSGPSFRHPMLTTKFTKTLGYDPRRAVAHLVSDDDWLYSRNNGGEGVTIPANVVLTISHCDEVWTKATASDQDCGVITEVYAD